MSVALPEDPHIRVFSSCLTSLQMTIPARTKDSKSVSVSSDGGWPLSSLNVKLESVSITCERLSSCCENRCVREFQTGN